MPELDLGQIIFLILVVIVGFIRWVGNLIQQQKEARERAKLSPEEQARRDAAWRRQVGQDEPAEEIDPFHELRELFEQFNEPPPQPPPPPRAPAAKPVMTAAAPPPLPVARSAPVSVAPPPAAFPASSAVQRAFTEAREARAARRFAEAGAKRARPASQQWSSLRRQLASPRALRQAILVREILGPPVALR